MHGSDLYRVRESDALARFESVKLCLLEASELGDDSPFVKGFHEWQSLEPHFRIPSQLFHAIRRAEREAWIFNDALSLTISDQEERSFWQRWRHLNKWHWANYTFEWALLTGLATFIVWPGIRGWSRYYWAASMGLAPLLFMLPTYLGYASFSYTSAGLSGGIVYPYLLGATSGGRCNSWDRWLLEHCPQILEPLSAPIGEAMSISGGGMPGPTSVLKLGMSIAVVALVIPWAWQWCLRKTTSRRNLPTNPGTNTSGSPFSAQ